MSLNKEIAGLMGIVLTAITIMGAISLYTSMANNAYRAMQGDPDAVGDMANDAAEQLVDEVQWSIGIGVIIWILGILAAIGLPVGAIIAVLKRNC
jgi:hypothetical protein